MYPFRSVLFILALVHSNLVQHVQATTTRTVTACSVAQRVDYGACSNLSIKYFYDNASGVSSYAPSNRTNFRFDRSTDLANIESSICYTLGTSSCNASSSAISLCWEVFWLYSGLTGSQGVEVWNNLTGQSPNCGSWTSTSSSTDATTILVSTLTTRTTLTSTSSTSQSTRPASSQRLSSSTLSSSTSRSMGTFTSDTTVTQTITSFTSSSTTMPSSLLTSDPFSMNGTPFIYNGASRLAVSVVLSVFAIVMFVFCGSFLGIFS